MHAKFQDHRPIGSGKADFLRFLTYNAVATIVIGHAT